jgi:ankyrin repeat protein
MDRPKNIFDDFELFKNDDYKNVQYNMCIKYYYYPSKNSNKLQLPSFPSKNLNKLQILILSSNEEYTKNFLKNNIHHFRDEINHQNEMEWTALMMACANSDTYSNNDIIELLLKNGADPNLKNNFNWTALMLACDNSNNNSNNKTVKLLLKYGADPNLKDNDGWTALMISCSETNTHSNNETVKLLLKYGAELNLFDKAKNTALMIACMHLDRGSDPETIKFLLEQDNIDVKIASSGKKYNALMILCKYKPNYYDIAKILKSKTDLNHRNYKNKKIEDICLDEYKTLFSITLEDILQKYQKIESECFICNEENTDCIKCEYDHHTCFVCLSKVKFICEACRNPF